MVVATSGAYAVAATGATVLLILLAMMWTARDARRHARHERFEVVHRYGGWMALAILTGLVIQQAVTSLPADAAIVAVLAQPAVQLLVAVLGRHPGPPHAPRFITGTPRAPELRRSLPMRQDGSRLVPSFP
jgi:hypothetical protein